MTLNLRRGIYVVAVLSLSCKQPQTPAEAPDALGAPSAGVGAAADPAQELVLIGSQHDTLSAAREGLEAALKLPVDLPLPFPRVERHADGFRVVLARGKAATLRGLQAALQAAGQRGSVMPAGQAGGDDIIRLGIVCTDGAPAPLYRSPLPKDGVLHEVGQLPTGQVVIPKEEDEAAGDGDDGERHGSGHEPSPAAESGYLTVLQPRAGLLLGPTVLLPADCTPRDEDNDDGNGRLLQGGRLCLTTRFSGKQGQVPHADLLAVTPNYRRCVRFPEAGTFDGFDHDAARTQFAVEALLGTPEAGPAQAVVAGKLARPQQLTGLHIYAVSEHGKLLLRGQLPGLQRPAYLGDHLVAVAEPPPGSPPPNGLGALPGSPPGSPPGNPLDKQPGLVVLDGIAKLSENSGGPIALPPPRRIFSFAPGTFTRLTPKLPLYRPAAPTLQDGRVRASFQESCRPDGEKRVRAAAKAGFVQCVMEVEVEVALDGTRPQQRCRLDNAQNNLDEPLPTPCPT
jgi:hypothetical protein